MSRPTLVSINNRVVPVEEARIPVLDRGFLFGDGVYEVIAVLGGRPLELTGHRTRLQRSLQETGIPSPFSGEDLDQRIRNLIRREELDEGMVYIQVTRGVEALRSFPPPDPEICEPTTVLFCQDAPLRQNPLAATGIAAVTTPDIRWRRRDIKSTSLLAQVMAKGDATRQGAFEAIMTEDGMVTEGASSAVFAITPDQALVTAPSRGDILDSITRRSALRIAEAVGLRPEIRSLSVRELAGAREAFIASATALILPIVNLDGRDIGGGSPGPLTRQIRETYLAWADAGDLP